MKILSYQTSELAYLAAAKFRSEGYIANVCDQHVSALWGPVVTDGVRVFVSCGPVDTLSSEEHLDSESDGDSANIEIPLTILRCLIVGLAVIGLIVWWLYFLYQILSAGWSYGLLMTGAISIVAMLLCSVFLSIGIQKLFARSVLRRNKMSSVLDLVLLVLVLLLMASQLMGT